MREKLSKSKKSSRTSLPEVKKSPQKPALKDRVQAKKGALVPIEKPKSPAKKTPLKPGQAIKATSSKKLAPVKPTSTKLPKSSKRSLDLSKVSKNRPAKKFKSKSSSINALNSSSASSALKLSIQSKPNPSPAQRKQIAHQALRAFEQAVKIFNLRQFSEAKQMFEELQQRYHQEVEIISRSQTYIQVCNVKLTNNQASPHNADDFYDRGVVALNVGNFSQARTFFEKALKLRPDDSYTLYSLAATHAQSGAPEQALTYLQQAVQKQPRLRHQALNDNDFIALKEDRRFLELLGATSPFDLLDARREIS